MKSSPRATLAASSPRGTAVEALDDLIRTYVLQDMTKPSLREAILSAGLRVMFQSGYQGTGVRDICAAAGAPQGSFTNHFRSKEAFARDVLDRYFANVQTAVNEALNDKSLSPRQRLKRYLEIISGRLEDDQWRRGCLIGDFSLEASSQSDLPRATAKKFSTSGAPVRMYCGGPDGGEIDSKFDPVDSPSSYWPWEGAILRMKVERAPAHWTASKPSFSKPYSRS